MNGELMPPPPLRYAGTRSGSGSGSRWLSIVIILMFGLITLLGSIANTSIPHQNHLNVKQSYVLQPKAVAPRDPAPLPSSSRDEEWPYPRLRRDGGRYLDPSIGVRDHDGETFLVVVGIPTTDTSFGSARREWQRKSWLTYRQVWQSGSGCADPTSCMLVKYLVGRHPANEYRFTQQLREEARRTRGEIIGLNMKEGVASTGKKSGGGGYWGLQAEVGMSRKALMWYSLSTTLFPRAQYIMKADDDAFIRVPQYLHDLVSLTQQQQPPLGPTPFLDRSRAEGLYWGLVMKWGAVKGDPKSTFYYVGGMAITVSARLADVIASYGPIQEHIGDYVEGADPKLYKDHNMDHEDVMIGRIFYNLKRNVTLVKDCRYHDVHVGANVKKVTDATVVAHHLKEEEYVALKSRFGDGVIMETKWRPTSAKAYHTAVSPC